MVWKMDDETQAFLSANELAELIPTFEEKRIDMSVLRYVSHVNLNEIVSTFGDRIRLDVALTKFVTAKDFKDSPLYRHRSSSADTILLNSSASSSAASSPWSSSASFSNKNNLDEEPVTLSSVNIKEAIAEYSFEAKHLMKTSTESSFFTRHEQKLIAKAIVNYALKHLLEDLKINAVPVIETLCNMLVAAFTKERLDVYYRAPVKNLLGRQCMRASGRVMERYYRNTRQLKEVGQSPRQLKRKVAAESVNVQHKKRILASDLPLDYDTCTEERYEQCKEHLRHNFTPWKEVEAYWRESSVRRLRAVYSLDTLNEPVEDKASHTVMDVTKQWPIVTFANSYSLLDIDFCLLYQINKSPFYDNWNSLKPGLKLLLEKELLEKSMRRKMAPYLTTENVPGEDSMLLHALPFLFPPTYRVSANKKKLKSTCLEAAEGFLSLCPKEEDVMKKVTQRRERLSKYEVTMQPFVVAVGDDMADLKKCFVVIDQFYYIISDPVNALDVCFKSIHALGANYDVESKQCWLFLQLAFYDIITKYDDEISNAQVNAFVDRLKNYSATADQSASSDEASRS